MKSVLPVLLLVSAVSRLAAADFTVLNTNSSGQGSLFQAITDANSTPGADHILFDIPGAGVHMINVGQNPLPTIIESLIIDGYSQPAAKPNTLAVGDNAVILIQIYGGTNFKNLISGLMFDRKVAENGRDYLPSNYTVRGLSLTGFYANNANSKTNGGVAIGAIGTVDSLVVAGNFIGVLPDGHTTTYIEGGFVTGSTTNTIGVVDVTLLGGTDPASRNVISGNIGVGFYGVGVVQGNYFGTDPTGTQAIPNGTALKLEGNLYDTIIGGSAPGAGNLISGNGVGVDFGFPNGAPAVGARIVGNKIGVRSDGVSPLPNSVAMRFFAGAADNMIGGLEAGAGNVIAFNGFGIMIGGLPFDSSTTIPQRNRILSNAIYGTRAVGIDLNNDGPTPNDAGDPDIGPNALQNAPVIESAEIANGSVTIKGRLSSTGDSAFTLQYFSESLDLVRPVQTYLGSSSVTTDSNGNAQFAASFSITDTNVAFNMTATSPDGNTSEFARNSARFSNISTRALVQTGDHVPIVGVIAHSLINRELIVRAVGPSLRAGNSPLPGRLLDPVLEVHGSGGPVNDNWRDDFHAGYVEFAGLAPTDDREAALWLPSGAVPSLTAVVRGAHGATGIAVAEAYDFRTGRPFSGVGETANISTRGVVGTGDNVMIAGVILEDTPGMTRIVARALGPSLAAAGVSDPLIDPVLELRDTQGALIASNDNWRDGQRDALLAVGLAPTNDNESAIFMRLPSGAYTAIVRGKGSATGVALIELYNLH